MSGGIVNNFLLKKSVNLFGFVKMSVELHTRHNPFPHFLPHIIPTYLHHLFPCCYDQPKKSKGDSDVVSKDDKSISKILVKNLQAIKKIAEKEGISINQLIKTLKTDE